MASSKIVEKLRRRAVQNFMDIFILMEMKKGSLSGYDVITLIHRRFGMLVSSGTVYSLLYSMEREGWIEGVWTQRKRIYKLTEKGEQNIKAIAKANEEIQDFLRKISLLNKTQQQPTPT